MFSGEVKRNCWFCNTDQKVRFLERNWWKCKQCEQYNGFKEDGDYLKDVPEMRREIEEPTPKFGPDPPVHPVLCQYCERSSTLTVMQYNFYDPSRSSQSEIDKYLKYIESTNRLCRLCEKKVQIY